MQQAEQHPAQPAEQRAEQPAEGPEAPRGLALVTGASSGIGAELAVALAEEGCDLVLTAEAGDLDHVAQRVRAAGAAATTVPADLATAAGVQALYEGIRTGGRPLEVLALNAGIGLGGRFAEQDIERCLRIVDLNVRSTVHLARLVVPDMLARGAGRILLTSSIAATMPGPYQAVYNASKSFVQSFAEALAEEVTDGGVTVTALMPGPTDTDFFRRAGMLDTPVGRGPKDDPVQVAHQGVAGLRRGDRKVLAGGLKSKAQGRLAAVLPDQVKAAMHRRMAEPDR